MPTLLNDSKAPALEADDAPEPPPRGVKAMAIFRWLLVILAAVAAVGTWTAFARDKHAHGASGTASAATAKYQCPMHPQIVSDEPGECPICHMMLQPVAADRVAPSGSAPNTPTSGDPHAGHTMPGMVMAGMSEAEDAGHVMSAPPPGSVPPGTTPITLAFDRVQSIGVRTAVAEERDTGGTLRVTATVAAPEQGAAEVHVRAAGFVERISVRETGVKVGAGQELLGLYSPDVFQAESELLAAKSFGDQGARSIDGARQRLELLGMPAPAIDEVLATGKAMRIITIASPTSGYVSKKSVVLGSYVTPETALYEIVDLSRVYVVADVFQRDIESVRVGTDGRFTPLQQPERVLAAKVDLIYPQLDAEARTTRVRMQVKNERLELRPGQYGNVDFALRPSKVVVVPRDAVVDMGRVTYVFVDEGAGRYTPRVIAVGRELDDGSFEVLAGVTAGDRVVSGATFLIDSESRLQASIAGAGGRATPAVTACDADFDRAKYPDKWAECQRCEKQHAGMGSMVDDCKESILSPGADHDR
jgi:membrane fusion protein, copper/silver efflux system